MDVAKVHANILEALFLVCDVYELYGTFAFLDFFKIIQIS